MRHSPEHEHFLRRARRRWVAWRIVECAGIGAAVAAGFGLILVLVLVWRGEPAISLAATLIGIGAVAGAIFGAMHTPTILQTAIQADRQLGLHDLLSTAVLAARARDQAFAAIVLSQATAVCRTRSPNELIVQKLGGRAWGGIGIATALMLTISMMSTQPGVTQASRNEVTSTNAQRGNVTQPGETMPSLTNERETASRPEHQTDGGGSEGSTDAREGADRSNHTANASGDGTGSSAGRTPDAQVPTLRQGESRVDETVTNDTTSSAGTTATQSTRTNRHAPPWQSSQWPSVREAAMKDVQSGRTPDAYRDLVREYFNDRHDD